MKKLLLISLIALLIIGCSQEAKTKMKERTITKQELGKDWPIKTTDRAIIRCYTEPNGIQAPVVVVDGIPYGLTGYADIHYGQQDLKAFNKIWADDPRLKGLKIDLSKLTQEAMKLCDTKEDQ